ncbi:D-alanyl-D-alanine carboxypeptidase family protein [Mechercharimyces sp. CAU 1602]|uniref:M15 family metallopeptidase n=1 Tax=Mechercharimyces sp. CAU 1602 TaxID=2973933 RepID=UPI002163E579|nr:M15 family metallopeptidase [Mechercharimyces sp. CAU 1602]MCS1352544.1 M15 family metallopeptidase [Mechercharimyces sp. CAU 1602]
MKMRLFMVFVLISTVPLFLSACQEKENTAADKKQTEDKKVEQKWVDLGVSPESFVEVYNLGLPDKYKLDPKDFMELTFAEGKAKVEKDLGSTVRFTAIVTESRGKVSEVKISGVTDEQPLLFTSVLRAIHQEATTAQIEQRMQEVKANPSAEKEIERDMSWEHVNYRYHQLDKGWMLLIQPRDLESTLLDPTISYPKAEVKDKEGAKKEEKKEKTAENKTGEDGIQTVSNPTSVLVLVNKSHRLPSGYVPALTKPNVRFPFSEDLAKKKLRPEAATALEGLFTAAKQAGHILYAQSGYRSYERQESIFAYNAQQMGEKEANRVSARPGQSEHQTGLAMDITSQAVNYSLEPIFGETAEGKWVAANAHKYGFIIRYPQGKEGVTGYSYEPWHLRYVGIEAATKIKSTNSTLEEYLK